MGCSSSGNVAVEQDRRRLSVGHVEGGGNEADTATTEEDRGMITKLGEQNIMDLLGSDDTHGGRKMSVGSATDQSKTSFANKTMQQQGDELDPANMGIGYTCRKGLKPESPNQDSWFLLKMDDVSIYGVFDGHGQKGHDVSNFVKDTLPKLIIKDDRLKSGEFEALLDAAFKKCQSLVATADRMKKLSAQMSGTTCTVALHDHQKNRITVGHVADSTAVVGKLVNGKIEGEAVTRDHKPNLKDERARIEKNGGRVVFDGYANHRIYAKNARYPGLNMSRCIGDLMGHQDCGVTAEPETKVFDITADYKLILLCSDGVWEFIQPTAAVQLVYEFPPAKAMAAAERLAKEAWDRWIKEEGGAVVDDITVVLVHLNQTQ